MSNIMIVLDGLEDLTYDELGGKTPYDWGKGEGFRTIESACKTGRLATTPEGFEPDTQTCILTLLGVGEQDIPLGRSYIEALAVGLDVDKSDMVIRCNFVKITPDGILEIPTFNAPDDIANMLMSEVAAVAGNIITRVGPYKCLQIIKGGAEFLDTMKTFPPHNYSGRPLKSLLPHGNTLAASLADFTLNTLEAHAPYTVLNWAQAACSTLPGFSKLHNGLKGGMVSATHAPMGCAIAMGMQCPGLEGATGDIDTNLAGKVAATLDLMNSCDFVMLHVGGPDEATHRQNVMEKAEFVKKLDEELISPILQRAPDGTNIMVTCDHVAHCTDGGHTDEPVKFMLYKKKGNLSGDIGTVDAKQAVEITVKA